MSSPLPAVYTVDGKLRDQLIAHEGLRRMPYVDTTGHLTIGVGRNLTTVGITQVEALYLLENDIERVTSGLRVALPWWAALDEVRRRVLADMCFNLGIAGLLKFRRTLAFVKSGDYAAAAAAMKLSKWHSQVGRRAERLERMMASGLDDGG